MAKKARKTAKKVKPSDIFIYRTESGGYSTDPSPFIIRQTSKPIRFRGGKACGKMCFSLVSKSVDLGLCLDHLSCSLDSLGRHRFRCSLHRPLDSLVQLSQDFSSRLTDFETAV